MCVMCDGASLDECLFDIHGIIDSYGWFIQYVEGPPVTRAWAYTIGLAAGFDHPELVVIGVDMETAAQTLNGIGEMIRAGKHFTPDHCLIDPDGDHTHFSEVHPRHFERGVFAVWVDYYECLGSPLPEAKALEIVLPGSKPLLAESWSAIG